MARTRPVVAVALFCAAANAQSLQLSQTSLTFVGAAGGDSAPPQSIVVTSSTLAPVRFTVSTGGSKWLAVSPPVAVTPYRISVAVDPSALGAGAYQDRISIADSSGAYGAITVPVTFTVDVRQPALDVAPNSIRLGEQDLEDTLFVRNAGGGRFSFSVSLQGAAPWIVSVTPNQGVVGPNLPVPVRVRASAQGLRSGAYRAVLRFTSTAGAEDVPVAFFVGGPAPRLATQPHGIQFEVRQGAGTAFSRRIVVMNKGTGTLNWTADLIEGSDWVKLSATSGVSTPSSSSALTISADNASLPVRVYYALLRLTSPEAQNSPHLVPIVLNVLDPAIPPRPSPSPAGLFFVAIAGQPAPPAQPVQIFASSSQSVAYQVSGASADGSGWLALSATSGVTSSTRTGQTNASVNHTNLKPGVYTGEIAYAFSNSDVRGVSVTLIVLPTGARLSSGKQRLATGCTPTRLALTQSGLVSNFSVPAGWPVPLTIQLTDDCGSPVLTGQVVLTYSNGDPAQSMALTDPDDGSYSATWVPNKDAANVSITAQGSFPSFPAATALLTGTVSPNKVPILFTDGTANNLNVVKGAALAPGTVASIFGSGLAAAAREPGVVPLTTSVNGTRVLVGAVEAPLYFVSDGQINAQIPMELAPDRQYQVLVSANGAFTVPDTIALTGAQPGLAASAADSRVIAHHANFTVINTSAPARPGEAIILYLVGMGQTDPPVRSGAAASTTSLSKALAQPVVTIDGKPADIFFAGLTPGSVGLYQINLTVPSDARSGDLPVAITQGGAQSNPGVLPVR